jgi:hypothetical protein
MCVEKTAELRKALGQNDCRGRFDGWKAVYSGVQLPMEIALK